MGIRDRAEDTAGRGRVRRPGAAAADPRRRRVSALRRGRHAPGLPGEGKAEGKAAGKGGDVYKRQKIYWGLPGVGSILRRMLAIFTRRI